MSEVFPNNFESLSDDEENKKKKRIEGFSSKFELPKTPQTEKAAGDTPPKFGEDFLRPKPPEPEPLKKQEEPSEEKLAAEKLEQKEQPQTELTQNPEPYRQTSAAETHTRAAQEQLEHLQMMQETSGEEDDETKKKRRADDAAVVESTQGNAQPAKGNEPAPENVSPASDTSIAPAIESLPPAEQAETEAAFQTIAQQPELAELAAVTLPEPSQPSEAIEAVANEQLSEDEAFRELAMRESGEDPGKWTMHELSPKEQAEQASFDRLVQEHPELEPLAAANASGANVAVANADSPPPEAADLNPAANSLPNNLGGAETPNTPNQPQDPNSPPGGFGNPDNPSGSNGRGGNNGGLPPNQPPGSPNFGNPNFPNQPANPNVWMPGGNALNPAVWMGLSALAAQQKMNSLRHTAREIGLAGAVGVLGLGLAAEHIAAKRRDQKLGQRIDQQHRVLQQTNETVRSERLLHHETRQKLEHLRTDHSATNEQLQRTQLAANRTPEQMTVPRGAVETPIVQLAETAAGTSIISATAMAELAANAAKNRETMPTMNDRHLAKQLRHNRELGKAIRRNPELRRALEDNRHLPKQPEQTGEGGISRQTENTALGETLPPVQQIRHELPEVAATAAAANVIRDETRHERLGAQHTGASLFSGVASGSGATDASSSTLSAPGLPTLQPDSRSSATVQNQLGPAEPSHAKQLSKDPRTWGVITTIVVALVAAIFLL